MYGNLHRELALSEKHAKASVFANLLWDRLLAFAVPDGRFSADPALVRAAAFPRFAFRLGQIERAISELTEIGLFHRYDVEGKPLLIYHDWSDWGPRLKSARSGYPPPPSSLCRCCAERSRKGVGPPSPLLSSQCPEGQETDRLKTATETLRARLARAYQAVNGGTAEIETLGAHFVQLEHKSLVADPSWLAGRLAGADMLGLTPWAAAARLRIAWDEERQRRLGDAASKRAAAAEPAQDDLQDPATRKAAVQSRAQAIRKGLIRLDAIDPDLRAEVQQQLSQGGA